jgi:hypothetical protein
MPGLGIKEKIGRRLYQFWVCFKISYPCNAPNEHVYACKFQITLGFGEEEERGYM